MAKHSITINKKGTPKPKHINFKRGDIVSFKAAGAYIVLCVPTKVFGANRIEIPAGETVAMVVKPDAPQGIFRYVCCNYPDYKCGDPPEEGDPPKAGKGDSGGGKVGPPF